MKTLEERIEKLLSKTEAMVLLTSSISDDANEVKIPNIVVNAVSVLIMSLNNFYKGK